MKAFNPYCHRNHLFSYGMKTSLPRVSWRCLQLPVSWREASSFWMATGWNCYICCIHFSSSLQPLGNQQHGGNLSVSVQNSLTLWKMDPSSWFLIVFRRLFMTRFLYLLSLLKKEKKRKKGAGCLFNFEQMEKIMYWWFFVPERNQDCVLIFFPPICFSSFVILTGNISSGLFNLWFWKLTFLKEKSILSRVSLNV